MRLELYQLSHGAPLGRSWLRCSRNQRAILPCYGFDISRHLLRLAKRKYLSQQVGRDRPISSINNKKLNLLDIWQLDRVIVKLV